MCYYCAKDCHVFCVEEGYKPEKIKLKNPICECASNNHEIKEEKFVKEEEKTNKNCVMLDVELFKASKVYINKEKKLFALIAILHVIKCKMMTL